MFTKPRVDIVAQCNSFLLTCFLPVAYIHPASFACYGRWTEACITTWRLNGVIWKELPMAFDTLALSIYCYLFSEIASSEVTWPVLTGSETGKGKYSVYLPLCLPSYLKVKVTPWHAYAGKEGTRHYKGVGGEHQAPPALAPGNTWRHLYKRLGGLRGRGRSCRHRHSNVRHPSNRYTDYATSGPRLSMSSSS